MGSGNWDRDAYRSFASSTVGKRTEEIYSSRSIHRDLDPRGVKARESRDSADNPQSTPIIIALDVTGSMGMIADQIAREGLGTLFTNILDRKPVTDPHLMFMGVGDVDYDKAPLQVSQFEADARIIQQLAQLWLEHGGGGNDHESYHLPWYFAAFHTVHDAMEKRGLKGFLFTVGDERAPPALTRSDIAKALGADGVQRDIPTRELFELASRVYHVFHIIIAQGSYARSHLQAVEHSWREVIGQHAITLADYSLLPETIVSLIEVARGDDARDVSARWSDERTQQVVHDAIKQLPKGGGPVARAR